jgi:hypothetical protein
VFLVATEPAENFGRVFPWWMVKLRRSTARCPAGAGHPLLLTKIALVAITYVAFRASILSYLSFNRADAGAVRRSYGRGGTRRLRHAAIKATSAMQPMAWRGAGTDSLERAAEQGALGATLVSGATVGAACRPSTQRPVGGTGSAAQPFNNACPSALSHSPRDAGVTSR